MKTLSMPDSARVMRNQFDQLCESSIGLHHRYAHPHTVKYLRSNGDRHYFEFKSAPFLDVNPGDKAAWTGCYRNAKTMFRAYMRNLWKLDRVYRWRRAVGLYRRSGLLGDLGKQLMDDFKAEAPLRLPTDDLGLPSENRIRYAEACAARYIKQGKATCPHCGGHNFIEGILGYECQTCQAVWNETPETKGWEMPMSIPEMTVNC